jgi:3-methyladenine DNA glycosylase Tag
MKGRVVGNVTFGRGPGVREVPNQSDPAMTPLAEIFARAVTRKDGRAALEQILATTARRPPAEIASTPDDPILAEVTRRIFYAGFSTKVIDDKWPAFEAGFDGFDPNACAFMSEEHFDRLLQDSGIVRNAAKIKSVQVNAQFVVDLKKQHGTAARFFANWADTDYVGFRDVLKKRASHLSGDAASYNRWSSESGRDLTTISRILAMSGDLSETAPSSRAGRRPV